MLKIIVSLLSLYSLSAISVEVHLIETFMVGNEDGAIRELSDNHSCQGKLFVNRAMSVPPIMSDGYVDWNNTSVTPDYGKTIKVYTLKDGKSWLFSVESSEGRDLEAYVGFGLFCVEYN